MTLRYPFIFSLLLTMALGLPVQSSVAQASDPPAIAMQAASPNPFTDATRFTVSVTQDAEVTVEVYNVLGQRIRSLYSGRLRAGEQASVRFEASGLPSGLYVIRTHAGGAVKTQMVTLNR
jgi:hypothetical protein